MSKGVVTIDAGWGVGLLDCTKGSGREPFGGRPVSRAITVLVKRDLRMSK